jgi:hypothetical protein
MFHPQLPPPGSFLPPFSDLIFNYLKKFKICPDKLRLDKFAETLCDNYETLITFGSSRESGGREPLMMKWARTFPHNAKVGLVHDGLQTIRAEQGQT